MLKQSQHLGDLCSKAFQGNNSCGHTFEFEQIQFLAGQAGPDIISFKVSERFNTWKMNHLLTFPFICMITNYQWFVIIQTAARLSVKVPNFLDFNLS